MAVNNMEEMKKELDLSRQTIEKLQRAIEGKETSREQRAPQEYETDGDEVPARRSSGEKEKTSQRPGESQIDDQSQASSGRRPTSISLERRLQLLQQPPKNLREVLENYLVMELALSNWVKKRPVLIGDTRTLERALSRINNHEILSLPVVDSNKSVIGIIDVLDLADAVNHALKGKSTVNVQNRIRSDFMGRTIGNLLGQKQSKIYVISQHTSLLAAAQHLVELKQERFLIVERKIQGDVAELTDPEATGVDGLLTQSDILRFLAQNLVLLSQESHFQKSLRDLDLGIRKPKIVSLTDNVAQIFMEMGSSGLHGAAVVDNQGKLFASISVSDLKGMTRRNCVMLNSNIDEFLKRDRKRGWWVRPITVEASCSLYQLILMFAASKIHRIYLVDNEGKPTGEINHADVLAQINKI
jgi:CBS domain-containing protein